MKYIIMLLLFIPASALSYVYDCGQGSTAVISHPTTASDRLYINNVGSSVTSDQSLVFPCYSSLSVQCDDGIDLAVNILPDKPNNIEFYRSIVSFFVGTLAAVAFVVAVDTIQKGV